MKHFVYFDKDFIDSYLSQIDGGLITSLQEEVNDWVEQGQIETIVPEHMDRDVGFTFMQLLSLKYKITDETFTTSNSTKQIQIAKEFVNKVIHDDSYDKLIGNLESNSLIKHPCVTELLNIGDYVYINDNVNIINLSHIIDAYGDDFADIYTRTLKGNLEESFSGLSREQKRSKETVKSKAKIDSEIKQELEDIESGVKMMKFMAKMLPSDIFIIYENFLIPLNRRYFREEPSSIKFKYTGKVNILGRLTGDLEDVLAEGEHGILTDVLNSLNELTLSMLGMVAPEKDLKILYPISLYFE